jgi:hypothetical protein
MQTRLITFFLLGVAILVGISWNFADQFEKQAADSVEDLIETVNEQGVSAANGVLGSDPHFARNQWKKSGGILANGFDMEQLRFSHKSKAMAGARQKASVFIVRGQSGQETITLEVFAADSKVIDWLVRTADGAMLGEDAVAAGCDGAYAIAQCRKRPIVDWQPPWIKFPQVPRYSRDWYEAGKHEYILELGQSWFLLDPIAREEIVSKFPEPEEWREWFSELGQNWRGDPLCPKLPESNPNFCSED